MARKRFTISDLTHRVTVCSMQDVVVENGIMALTREGIYTAWANIESLVGKGSMINNNADAIMQSSYMVTHRIYTRYRSDVDITSAAWLYIPARKSPPRWFKVLLSSDYVEDGQYFCFQCRLLERGEEITPPVVTDENDSTVAVPLPSGVVL